MGIEREPFWDAPAKAELQVAVARLRVDRDRWRREFEMERAKVRRVEHDLRGAVEALTEIEERASEFEKFGVLMVPGWVLARARAGLGRQ